MLMLGTAKRCITPRIPVRLCGYAVRKGVYDGVREDIFLRVYALQDGKTALFLFYADLIWWNSDFIAKIRPALAESLGVQPESLLFVASHNHSGPGTGNNLTALLESADEAYTEFLSGQIREAAEEAQAHPEPVAVRRFDGQCCMNVYRRLRTPEGIQMMPNYGIPADRTLTALGFYRTDGSLKGVLLHYPCHANLSNENYIQPDYPGMALRMLDEAHPGSVSLFLQGCTGDLRPNSVLGSRFTPCDFSHVAQFAKDFYGVCQTLLERGGRETGTSLRISHTSVRLKLNQTFTRRQAEKALESPDEAVRQWAEKVLAKSLRPYETLYMTRLDIGSTAFYFLNAEAVQSYAAFARTLHKGALTVGYTNGMIGYLASAPQIAAGGYEPQGSARYFALAGTYSPEIEHDICAAMSSLGESR